MRVARKDGTVTGRQLERDLFQRRAIHFRRRIVDLREGFHRPARHRLHDRELAFLPGGRCPSDRAAVRFSGAVARHQDSDLDVITGREVASRRRGQQHVLLLYGCEAFRVDLWPAPHVHQAVRLPS